MSTSKEQLALLVGIVEKSSDLPFAKTSIDELERLLNTAGATAFAKVIQIKDTFDARTLIGKGKVSEIAELVRNNDIGLVIFDEELSPMQILNLENDIGDVTVIDRSMLILDIFALHAKSGEGKLQVELAQLKYTAPRLIGHGLELSRQGGGIGSRGPGETKLETDRRHLKEKVYALEVKLRELENTRATMRAQRDRSHIKKIAIVGYTNAGKSTLINALTDANTLAEDKLFATLDCTTRKLTLPQGETVLITDTVGFIRKLPHHLVRAFKSTLDEVKYADILLLVSDASDTELREHIAVTEEVIRDLGANEKPIIYVYNKCDISEPETKPTEELSVLISGKSGAGIDELLQLIEKVIKSDKKEVKLLIPYTNQSALNDIYKEYTIKSREYSDNGVIVFTELDERGLGIYKKFIVE